MRQANLDDDPSKRREERNMGVLDNLRISGSALTAQRLRMDVISNNIANAESTRSADGEPYKRQEVVFTPITPSPQSRPRGPLSQVAAQEGVRVAAIVRDDAPPRMVFDPAHPDADAEGYVAYPDIDIITEMADMLSATRAYEANISAINAAKSMATKALEIGRG